jgi:hypothetical protein
MVRAGYWFALHDFLLSNFEKGSTPRTDKTDKTSRWGYCQFCQVRWEPLFEILGGSCDHRWVDGVGGLGSAARGPHGQLPGGQIVQVAQQAQARRNLVPVR